MDTNSRPSEAGYSAILHSFGSNKSEVIAEGYKFHPRDIEIPDEVEKMWLGGNSLLFYGNSPDFGNVILNAGSRGNVDYSLDDAGMGLAGAIPLSLTTVDGRIFMSQTAEEAYISRFEATTLRVIGDLFTDPLILKVRETFGSDKHRAVSFKD